MINKLKNKISLIVLLAIMVPLIIIVLLYDFSYYANVINSNGMMVDRFFEGPKDRQKSGIDKENIKERPSISNISGVYSVSIKDGKIISDNSVVSEIKEYALKISDKNRDRGIIGNYIYNKRVNDNNEINVILIESTNEIKKINMVFANSFIILGIGLLLIYLLSKKIASIIVRPVEETFTKQIEFISDASHELKTPLAVMQANADVLEGEIGSNKWLSYIQNETDNMGKLISELLLLTKIENVDKLRSPERFNMSDHIAIISSSFESMAYEKKVIIENKIQKDIIVDSFNKDDITHILSTLIDNAIKHTEKKVIIELIKNKDNIEINVKNKGEEIPIEEREKIFDRFYRIDKSRNRNEKRYGLGLAIAKATVLKNNGTIQVDYKGGYTVFTVKLPI